jgi:hypothetical protein
MFVIIKLSKFGVGGFQLLLNEKVISLIETSQDLLHQLKDELYFYFEEKTLEEIENNPILTELYNSYMNLPNWSSFSELLEIVIKINDLEKGE